MGQIQRKFNIGSQIAAMTQPAWMRSDLVPRGTTGVKDGSQLLETIAIFPTGY
jgi:hypothetical protein